MSSPTATEKIINLLNEGFKLKNSIYRELSALKEDSKYNAVVHRKEFDEKANNWGTEVVSALNEIFPTELEANIFLNPEVPTRYVDQNDTPTDQLVYRLHYYLKALDTITKERLSQYTDLPQKTRLYIEDIESFQKVRDINPKMVLGNLDNGFLDKSEEKIQTALERILGVAFHKKDWGGELNDLYTTNIVFNGARRSAAFLLKGNGIGKKEMTIADCGKNGDQLVRLFSISAELYVIQYVGNISELLIEDANGKALQRKALYLVMDGQDTARILLAYNEVNN